MKTKLILFAVAAASVLFPASSLRAGPPVPAAPQPEAQDGWWVRSASYAWLTAAKGDMRIGNLTGPVDVGFDDTIAGIDELDMGFMGGLEAGRGRWSLGVDLTYMKASDDIAGGGVLFKSFRLEQSQWMINPFLSYKAVKLDRWSLDVIAGARINIFELEISGRLLNGSLRTLGGSRTWVDPIVGLRSKWDITERLSFGLRGDIGGFGVSSSLTWQAYAGFSWQLNSKATLALGYRGLGTVYSSGTYGTDTISHGPLLGLILSF